MNLNVYSVVTPLFSFPQLFKYNFYFIKSLFIMIIILLVLLNMIRDPTTICVIHTKD